MGFHPARAEVGSLSGACLVPKLEAFSIKYFPGFLFFPVQISIE